jgi:hydrogenase maturation protein HypF
MHPPRIAFALLREQGNGIIPSLGAHNEAILNAMLSANVNCPLTTSLGRVFDAAAAILGLVDHATYESEGPIRLEGQALLARTGDTNALGKGLRDLIPLEPGPGDGRIFLVNPRPLLATLAEVWIRGCLEDHVPALSYNFHQAIAEASVEGAIQMRHYTGVSQIALSGGVFQNLLLRELLIPLLLKDGFKVFLNERAPAGDGGLAVGQAWFQES